MLSDSISHISVIFFLCFLHSNDIIIDSISWTYSGWLTYELPLTINPITVRSHFFHSEVISLLSTSLFNGLGIVCDTFGHSASICSVAVLLSSSAACTPLLNGAFLMQAAFFSFCSVSRLCCLGPMAEYVWYLLWFISE